MGNKQVILNLLDQFRDYISKVKILKTKIGSAEEFAVDWETEWKVDRALQLLIECSIDIGKEIIAGLNVRKPSKYQEVFIILAEVGVISPKLGQEMKKLAAFRNELVHDYLYLDRQKIYNVFQNDMKFFEQYLLEIENSLK